MRGIRYSATSVLSEVQSNLVEAIPRQNNAAPLQNIRTHVWGCDLPDDVLARQTFRLLSGDKKHLLAGGMSGKQTLESSRIIEMALGDRTPFEAIEALYGLNESAVIRPDA